MKKALSKYQLREFVVLFIVAIITLLCAVFATFQIPVIYENNTYVPQGVDYLRTFILASGTALLVNYLYRFVDVMLIYCKVWLEFLALLLLAYPQKTELSHSHNDASWNMVKRQGFLFGVCYQAVYMGFYLWDLWFVELNEEEMVRLVRDETDESLHREVILKSTLSNCIDFRRKSSSLKKVIYSNEYVPQYVGDDISNLNKADVLIVSDSLGGSMGNGNDSDDNMGHSCTMTAVVSRGSLPYENSSVDRQWIFENSLWIIVTTLYEIGISLILSISFIYAPEMDDSLFTRLEIFFYNKVYLFCIAVLSPLFILTSLVQILLHLAIKPHQRKTTFFGFAVLCVFLFVFGELST